MYCNHDDTGITLLITEVYINYLGLVVAYGVKICYDYYYNHCSISADLNEI